MIKQFVQKDYMEYLALHKSEMPDGLYESLTRHERIPVFFNKLASELETIDKRIKTVDRMMIKDVVYEMTKFFVNMVKTHADEARMSDLAKSNAVNNAKVTLTDEEAKEYTKELVGQKVLMGAEVERLASIKRLDNKVKSSTHMKRFKK